MMATNGTEGKSGSYNWADRDRRERLLRRDPHCAYCGDRLNIRTATLDHLTPQIAGGDDHDDNVVLACSTCNTAKGDQLPLNYIWGKRAGRPPVIRMNGG